MSDYPLKTIGILGGGQLGRMSALAAGKMGMRVHIFCPDHDSPASQVSAKTFVGEYSNKSKLKEFAQSVDVITYEFENIPVETVKFLQKITPVWPDERILEIAQHRGVEKKFLNDIGIETAKWSVVTKAVDVVKIMDDWGVDAVILKTTRFGYDGKGQAKYEKNDDIKAVWKTLKSKEIIVEEIIDFACEISLIIARDKIGQTACYPAVLNEHKNHILHQTTAPAPIPDELALNARKMAEIFADAVDLVGVLALELFITNDGRLLANEIAPRTHNSGHWTIDACSCDQFDQHIRTVSGMSIGLPTRHSNAVMINLIGRDVKKLDKYYEMKNTSVHLYGKDKIKDGRKMGHVTILNPINEIITKG